ncbi:MAG: hypothetical protein ABEJ87_05820 [Candidatus Nanohalobium sp.]
MEVYRVEGTYTQSGDHDRFRGELGHQHGNLEGHIDDIDQNLPEPERRDLRNKVVEGEAYPAEGQLHLVKRDFSHALRNVQKDEDADDYFNPQEVHVLAETPDEGLEGEYSGIWTINRPGELPLEQLGADRFELGWQLEPEAYETEDYTAEEIIDQLYDGELPEEPEEINTEQEISRGTTDFRVDRLENERAEEGLPLDVVNVALNGGVEGRRRVV